jgi:hypothetical protein
MLRSCNKEVEVDGDKKGGNSRFILAACAVVWVNHTARNNRTSAAAAAAWIHRSVN